MYNADTQCTVQWGEGRPKGREEFLCSHFSWASLVAQWLESACQCRGPGFYPWSRKIPHVTEQLSPWATTTEAHKPQLLSPHAAATEARMPRACALWREATAMRSPRTTMKSSPHSPQLEEARAQQQRPNTAKKKIFFSCHKYEFYFAH